MAKLRNLKKTIRRMRQRLSYMVDELGTFDTNVVDFSTQLDGVINEYYRIRKRRRRKHEKVHDREGYN